MENLQNNQDKKVERLAFKFFKSYFDIASELEDNDRLAFYDALIKKQFLNIEPELSGLSKFAYISQKHSIDKQVKGWHDKMQIPINQNISHPTQGGAQGGAVHPTQDPTLQEKEKEQEKVQEQEKEESLKEDFTSVQFTQSNFSDSDNSFEKEIVRKKSASKKFTPPSEDEVIKFFEENGFRSDIGKKAWNYYNDGQWKDAKGSPVRSWKQKCRGVWFKDEHKATPSASKKIDWSNVTILEPEECKDFENVKIISKINEWKP